MERRCPEPGPVRKFRRWNGCANCFITFTLPHNMIQSSTNIAEIGKLLISEINPKSFTVLRFNLLSAFQRHGNVHPCSDSEANTKRVRLGPILLNKTRERVPQSCCGLSGAVTHGEVVNLNPERDFCQQD